MNIEQGLMTWLKDTTGLSAYWLSRPAGSKRCIVYRCTSPGMMEGNLKSPGINVDQYSVTIYHDDPEAGKAAADIVKHQLNDFTGDLGGYAVQLIEFSSGFDQPLNQEAGMPLYQFNRDFTISH